jgi:hypothetical protein
MKPLSAFFPRILPYLPGCSEPFAAQALLTSAIEFCENSQVLRIDLDPISTVEGQPGYTLGTANADLAITRVLGVTLDGHALSGIMAEALREPPAMKARPTSFYVNTSAGDFELRLAPLPDDVYTLVANVALRPARDATTLHDDLYDLWIDPLVAGALHRCMLTPEQPFTNPTQALYWERMAAVATAGSRIEGNYGYVRGSMRVKSRPFF